MQRAKQILLKPYVWIPLIVVGVLGLSFIVLNLSYMSQQVSFKFNPPAEQSPADRHAKMNPNELQIPSLGITAPIVESEHSNEKAYQEALKKGVVHYPGTAKAGQVGNVYIFGHSSDLILKGGDYKTVFALLPSIKNDAEIIISDDQGQAFVYQVFEQFVANSADLHLLDQNTNGEKILTLQTSYPIGTALKRYIVKARLVE